MEEEKYTSEDDFFLEIKTVETLEESLDEQKKDEDSSKQISEELAKYPLIKNFKRFFLWKIGDIGKLLFYT